MKTARMEYESGQWKGLNNWTGDEKSVQLVFIFADRFLLESPDWIEPIKEHFPNAQRVIASTAGEISGRTMIEKSAVAIPVQFEKTPIQLVSANRKDFSNCVDLGKKLVSDMSIKDLKHVFMISDGSLVNGDELLNGMRDSLPEGMPITGGLAGDYGRFEKTMVGHNDDIQEGNVVLIGFYGENILITSNYQGGWDPFGPERIITKSSGNILHEIDNQNALDMYKKYLGKHAEELPSSALLFPLTIQMPNDDEYIVRTILSINDAEKSMTFAGNIPEGSKVRFMKANPDRLIHAASDAGELASKQIQEKNLPVDLAILISCVGRKVVLSQRIEEEVEAAADHMGPDTNVAGFFSYGEVAPNENNRISYLHNQTMTVTTFAEITD